MAEISKEVPSYTVPGMKKCLSQKWTIQNFSMFLRNEKSYLESTPFCYDDTNWVLRLYPDGIRPKTFIAVYLVLLEGAETNLQVHKRIAMLDKDGNEVNTLLSSKINVSAQPAYFGTNKFAKKDFLVDQRDVLLPNDTLTVFCQIIFHERKEAATDVETNSIPEIRVPECNLKEIVAALIHDTKFTDVVFKVENELIPAHKPILAARSSVFMDMFTKDAFDNRKEIEIPNIRLDVFKEMLTFIYSGNCPNITLMAQEILVISETYKLERLKAVAEMYLVDMIRIENAAAILILADANSSEFLKLCAIDFISEGTLSEVSKTEEWDYLLRNKFELVSSIIEKVSSLLPLPVKRRRIQD